MTCPICDMNICTLTDPHDPCLSDHLLFNHQISFTASELFAKPLDVLKQYIITQYMDEVLGTKLKPSTKLYSLEILSVRLEASRSSQLRATIEGRAVTGSNEQRRLIWTQHVSEFSKLPEVGDRLLVNSTELEALSITTVSSLTSKKY